MLNNLSIEFRNYGFNISIWSSPSVLNYRKYTFVKDADTNMIKLSTKLTS